MSLIPLITLRGLIASCAIENAEHGVAIERIDRLIDRFGILRTVDLNGWILPYLCHQKKVKKLK